eukprot:4317072-Amphidinium_carterae.1
MGEANSKSKKAVDIFQCLHSSAMKPVCGNDCQLSRKMLLEIDALRFETATLQSIRVLAGLSPWYIMAWRPILHLHKCRSIRRAHVCLLVCSTWPHFTPSCAHFGASYAGGVYPNSVCMFVEQGLECGTSKARRPGPIEPSASYL